MSTEQPEKVTQAEFARMQGWSRSHVTGLKRDGRLVTEGEGRQTRVLVNESLERISATEDPNRDDVRNRHAEARHAKARDGDGLPAEPKDAEAQLSYQQARAKKEHFLAKQAEADYQKMIGDLVDVAVVQKAGAELGTLLRTALENLQDRLAPEVAAESDPARIHAMLGEQIEFTLAEISRKLSEGVRPQ